MRKIELTRGKHATVDDKDFEWLNQWKWWCDYRGYAVRDIGGRKNKKRLLMHRLINNTPSGYHTDHINHDKLDNRRANLRATTPSQNILNSVLSKANRSGYKGVTWHKNRWVARIKVDYKSLYLGRYIKKEDAIKAREEAEKHYV